MKLWKQEMLHNIVQGESSQFSREVLLRTWVSKGSEEKSKGSFGLKKKKEL